MDGAMVKVDCAPSPALMLPSDREKRVCLSSALLACRESLLCFALHERHFPLPSSETGLAMGGVSWIGDVCFIREKEGMCVGRMEATGGCVDGVWVLTGVR